MVNTQVLRPFPQYSNVQVLAADIGNSSYNGLNLGVEKRYSAGLSLTANYTYSQFIDNVDARNELAAYPGVNALTNYYDQGSDKGRSGNDIHRFVLGSVYDLPVGVGRPYVPKSAVTSQVVGGWTVGLIAEVRSGTPLSPIELTNNTFSFSDGVRPNVIGNPNIDGSRPLTQQLKEWFNVNAFAMPAPFTFGNAGRTFGEGPGAISLDCSLLKNFGVREKVALEFRAEVLNFLNHPNFVNPDTRQGSPTFGQITSLMPGNQSRIIQLGLHLISDITLAVATSPKPMFPPTACGCLATRRAQTRPVRQQAFTSDDAGHQLARKTSSTGSKIPALMSQLRLDSRGSAVRGSFSRCAFALTFC